MAGPQGGGGPQLVGHPPDAEPGALAVSFFLCRFRGTGMGVVA